MRLIYQKNGPVHWNSQDQSFVVERSDYLNKISIDKIMEIEDKSTGKIITFAHTKTDTDGSGEDIYGWNYKSVSGATKPCKLLIIND